MKAFPDHVSEWTEEIINGLIESNYEEDQKIEYTQFLEAPNKTKEQNKQDIQEDFCAFANAYGGFIIFGIAKEQGRYIPKGVNWDGELNIKIAQILSNTTPSVKFERKVFTIKDRKIVVVQIFEADDKPIQCANGSFYMRINGGKQPLPRTHLMDLFVTKGTKQQLLGKLKFEIKTFKDTVEDMVKPNGSLCGTSDIPPFHKLRLKELQDAISRYYHIYSIKEVHGIITRINERCFQIETLEKYFNLDYTIHLSKRYGLEWTSQQSFLATLADSCTNINQRLAENIRSLKIALEELEKLL